MAKQGKKKSFIQGTATHRRTEGDYMSVLMDIVTLDDWGDVVAGALQAAKEGNPQARSWLAQYLMGKPETKAPAPLKVIVQQLSGDDPLVDRLAKPMIDQSLFPALEDIDEYGSNIKAQIAEELTEKFTDAGTDTTPEMVQQRKNSDPG